MVNLLIDPLPDTIEASGRSTPIRTDFKIGIMMDALIRDKNLSGKETVRAMLNLYLEKLPEDVPQAIDGILDFFACGKAKKRGDESGSSAKRNAFSYEYDAGHIAAAFIAQYGIDLFECDMHWHKFIALFKALTEENQIIKIIGYRSANLAEIKGRAEKDRIARLQALYALPEEYAGVSSEEIAGQLFGGGLF